MTTPPTIRSLRARSVLAPMPRPLRTASGAIPQAPLVLIDVQTDQDVVGRAYVFYFIRSLHSTIKNTTSVGS
jgi:mandelate racemase